MGFMVGKDAERSGIIRSGAKLVNAVSNSVVPKITVVVGNSFGAGNYALCGKAYDPNFIISWPNAKFAVMGADQAANTLFSVQAKAAERRGIVLDKEATEKMHADVKITYEQQMDIRYGAARGWLDAIIPPEQTREVLGTLLSYVKRSTSEKRPFHTGVIQV
jgi:acetyl-CoA carboxylase carboxyltransferase component